MIKKYSFLMLASMLVLGACGTTMPGDAEPVDNAPEATDEMTSTDEVIKIGFVGPMTGSAASYGQDLRAGIMYYFEQNPTIDGKTVEVIYEDGKCNGQDAANAAQKLISVDKVKFILGGLCSGESLAMVPIAEEAEVLMLSPGSSSPELTGVSRFFTRNYPSDEKNAETMVKDALKNHSKVAILAEQTDYAQGYRMALKKYIDAEGGELVFDEDFAVDASDFRTQLEKVRESEAGALFFIPQSPVAAGFAAKQAKEIGLEIQMYSGDTVPGDDFFNTAQDAAEGHRLAMAAEDPTREGYDELVAGVGEVQSSIIWPLLGYDASQFLAESIAEVGYDAVAVRNHWDARPVFVGVGSDIKIGEDGDNNVDSALLEAVNGEFVPVTE